MSKEAMKLALEALKQIDEAMPFPVAKLAQAALREALAEQPAQQEPVGTYGEIFESMRSLLRSGRQADQQIYMAMQYKPLYTSPPTLSLAQRKPLTDEQTHEAVGTAGVDLLELAKLWSNNKIHVYQFDNEARKIIKGVLHRAHSIKENT